MLWVEICLCSKNSLQIHAVNNLFDRTHENGHNKPLEKIYANIAVYTVVKIVYVWQFWYHTIRPFVFSSYISTHTGYTRWKIPEKHYKLDFQMWISNKHKHILLFHFDTNYIIIFSIWRLSKYCFVAKVLIAGNVALWLWIRGEKHIVRT